MNILKKILEEIDKKADYYECGEQGREHIRMVDMVEVEEIIRSHIDEVENGGWVPVEERLPEEKGWYQCTCSDKKIWNDDIVRDLYYYPKIKEFVDNIRYETNGLKNIEKYYWTKYVTAWKTLPEPYKPKEE